MLINLMFDNPQVFLLLSVSLIFALTFHEFAHAYVAYRCGDNTAMMMGRMNINPFSHLDLMGTLLLLFVGFGYAKPVPINPRNFKHRNGEFFVAAAGPGMNFLLAMVGIVTYHLLSRSGQLFALGSFPIVQFLYLFMILNMNLCIFNLIPLGPLDGSSVLPHFLPFDLKRRYQMWNFRWGNLLIVGLLVLGALLPGFNPFQWISWTSNALIQGLM